LGEKREATMADTKSYHGFCRWTFHAGKGGFVPEDMIRGAVVRAQERFDLLYAGGR
jgi:hypothetical protein